MTLLKICPVHIPVHVVYLHVFGRSILVNCYFDIILKAVTQARTHKHTRAQSGSKYWRTSWTAFSFIWLRAIIATSCRLWQTVCQSLGNPSKLVIYLFGILLTLSQSASPHCLSSLILSLSFISASSLSSRVFPCLPPTLASPSFILLSIGFSLLVISPWLYLALLPLFHLPCLPLTLKHCLCLSFFFSLTSLCSSWSLCLPHPSLGSSSFTFFSLALPHHTEFCCFSALTLSHLSSSSSSFSFSVSPSCMVVFSSCTFSPYFLPIPHLLVSSTFYRLLSHWPFPLMSLLPPPPLAATFLLSIIHSVHSDVKLNLYMKM